MVWKGWAMSSRMMIAVSPVLPVPQGAVYLVIPIAGAYMAVHLACASPACSAAASRPRTDPLVTVILFGVMLTLFALSVPIPASLGLAAIAAIQELGRVTIEVVIQRMFFGLNSS